MRYYLILKIEDFQTSQSKTMTEIDVYKDVHQPSSINEENGLVLDLNSATDVRNGIVVDHYRYVSKSNEC